MALPHAPPPLLALQVPRGLDYRLPAGALVGKSA